MNKRITLLITAALTATAPYAAAEVYSCGPGCYTSKPGQGSRVKLDNKIGSYTALAPSRSSSASTSGGNTAKAQNTARRNNGSSTSPATVAVAHTAAPKLSAAKASGRRTILEQELNNERAALASAQKALAEGRAVNGQSDAGHQTRIRQLESAVLDRQQNIQALQRELGRM